ncbi:MAG: M56 family metallopeptidase [Bacteroidota bacterium]
MFNIEQSPFLHALGYAIGHSLWQMSLLWLVYTGVIYLHQWSSSQRYNLAVTAATTGFAAFIITFIYYGNSVTINSNLYIATTFPGNETVSGSTNNLLFFYQSLMATLRSLAPYFSCAYLVVMMLLSIRLANGFNEVKKLRTRGLGKASADWRLFVTKHAALLGIKRSVQLRVSNIATSPLTIGFWKPFILIPLASINQLSPQQIEAVLLHELAHIRRNDYLLNIILQLAEIALFFNPFMRLLLKQARLERENSCDDYVLQFQYNATDYAKALLAIERHSVESILALGTNNNNEFQLLNRIKRMLAPERKAFNYRQQLGLLFIITILGLGFTIITPRQETPAPTAIIKQQPAVNTLTGTREFENAFTQPIDLIKNLENIQQFKKKNKVEISIAEKSKKLDVAITKVATDFEKVIEPHAKNIEALALQIEKLNKNKSFNYDQLKLNALQFKEIEQADWATVFGPAFSESVKLMTYPEVFGNEKMLTMPLVPAAPAPPDAPAATANRQVKLNRDQIRELKKLQDKISVEQKHLYNLSKVHLLKTDSLLNFLTNAEAPVIIERDLARARKQAAIAPFRQRDVVAVTHSRPAKENYRFKFFTNKSFTNNNQDENEDDVAEKVLVIDEPGVAIANNCECPATPKASVKTITFNGKALSEKVKQVWSEAKQQSEKGWTEEMQQKVVREIEKELKHLEQAEIKTRISTSADNNRTIIIEVEGME